MTRPETPFEQASYDLNQFRERRMAERRAVPRDSADRRAARGSGQADTRNDEQAHRDQENK